MIPIAGSAYTYAYATLGEIFAWIIGWDLILEYSLGAATVAVGWSGYVVSFLERHRDRDPGQPGAGARSPSIPRPAPGLGPARPPQPAGRADHRALITCSSSGASRSRRPSTPSSSSSRSRSSSSSSGPAVFFIKPRTLARRSSRPNTGAARLLRLQRHRPRRRHHLLRLHRLRRRLDRRPGGQEPPARHAHRHPRLARRLHRALHRRLARPDRRRALHRAQRAGPRRRGHRRHAALLAFAAGQDRRHRRPDVGHDGPAPRPAAHLLLHGQGRAAAAPPRPRSTRGSARPTSRRSSRASSSASPPRSCPSASSASWSASAPCSPSPSSAAASWSCATRARTSPGRSRPRSSRSSRAGHPLAAST